MIDLRIYRGTFVFVLIAIVLAMFSLDPLPRPDVATLAPDAFDGVRAYSWMKKTVTQNPDRRPGSRGDTDVAELISAQLGSLGYQVTEQKFKARSGLDTVEMRNIVGVMQGESNRRIVVMAGRDSANIPGEASSGSGTAVLVELARDIDDIAHKKTIEIVSTDGASAAAAGAAHYASQTKGRGEVDGVIVVDDLGSLRPVQPSVVPWSASDTASSQKFLRTVRRAVEAEAGVGPKQPDTAAQLLHMAFPLTLKQQGVLIEAGLAAATVTSHGELPRPQTADGAGSVSAEALDGYGKAALSTVLALDRAGAGRRGQSRYIVVLGRQVHGWTVSLMVLALLLPALVAAVDGFARARRRREKVAAWLVWALSGAVPFILTLLFGYLLTWIGLLPSARVGTGPDPNSFELTTAPIAAWTLLSMAFIALLVLTRRTVDRYLTPAQGPSEPGAAVALGLVLVIEVALLLVYNPYAAALVVPAAHLWLIAVQPDSARSRPQLVVLVALGLALPALVAVYYTASLKLGPMAALYLPTLFTGHSVGFIPALIYSLIAGALLAVISITRRRSAALKEEPIVTVRGPSSYAGPGSLGGTESALKR